MFFLKLLASSKSLAIASFMLIIHVDQLVFVVIVWFYGLLYDVIFAFVRSGRTCKRAPRL